MQWELALYLEAVSVYDDSCVLVSVRVTTCSKWE